MSYKSHKRRLQRLKLRAKLAFWKDVRKQNAKKAFEEWKKVNVPKIRLLYDQESKTSR